MKLPRKTSLALALCLLVSLALNPALAAKRVKPIPEVLAKREVIAAPQTRTLRLDAADAPMTRYAQVQIIVK